MIGMGFVVVFFDSLVLPACTAVLGLQGLLTSCCNGVMNNSMPGHRLSPLYAFLTLWYSFPTLCLLFTGLSCPPPTMGIMDSDHCLFPSPQRLDQELTTSQESRSA